MKKTRKIIFFMSMIVIFNSLHLSSFVPETIATLTLLKYGGAAVIAGVAGRVLVIKSKKFYNQFDVKLLNFPESESYGYRKSKSDESKEGFNQEFTHIAKVKSNIFDQIKEIISTEYGYKKLKKISQENFSQDRFNPGSKFKSQASNNYYQNNLHAQQARGFFAKINNYYYNPEDDNFWGSKNFWMGFAAGGIVFHYIDASNRKN